MLALRIGASHPVILGSARKVTRRRHARRPLARLKACQRPLQTLHCARPQKNGASDHRQATATAFSLRQSLRPPAAELILPGARARNSLLARLPFASAGRTFDDSFSMPGGRPAKNARTAAASTARRKSPGAATSSSSASGAGKSPSGVPFARVRLCSVAAVYYSPMS